MATDATEAIELSCFQQRLLAVPLEFDVFLGGGRGGAKSYTMAVLVLRHIEQYGPRAKALYIRQTHTGLTDFRFICLELFGRVYGKALRFNAQAGLFTFPNGGTLELNQLEGATDYGKFQGRSFTLLLIDEAGQYPTPELLDKLRSNLRGARDIPIRTVMAANPGDPGHHWLATRYVFKAAPWHPFVEDKSKRPFVYAPSLYIDNPFIDQDQYRGQLEAACANDQELLRAWLQGDWAVARGAYFGSCLDEQRNAVDPWTELPKLQKIENHDRVRLMGMMDRWDFYLAHDFGSSAPSVTYLVGKSPSAEYNGRFFPRDSLVLIDELASNEPGSTSKGLGWTVPTLAEAITEMCKRWGVRPRGCADDAIFARGGHGAGSIADEFRRCGVYFYPARKADRITGWQMMRRLLADAGKVDVPGLYVSRACEYFWATAPYLARDPKRIEDVDSRGPDHAADAARYACLHRRQIVGQSAVIGF